MLKVELHSHTADDPLDRIAHTSTELIDRAAALGYDALAITLHQHQLDIGGLREYAKDRGIVLIPGVERTIEGSHVLLLNFPAAATAIDTFAELARLRQRHRGLIVAPHAYFPASTCLRAQLDRHADLFDAVELNAMYTRQLDCNRRAVRWARRMGKPIVGNGDVHLLRQLGTTYSLIDAERHADAICSAVLDHRVQVQTRPLSWLEAVTVIGGMAVTSLAARPAAPSLSPART
jgi:predicted metal-dependent phosphoesterase TrpH